LREILKIWKETTYGTFPAPSTPVKNTDYVVIELSDSNPYTVRVKPKQKTIRTANSRNRLGKLYSTQYDLAGNLQTFAYPEQMPFLLAAACTLTSNEIPSYTVDHAVIMDDASNTVVYSRHLGVKVANFDLNASADDQAVKLQFQLIGKNTATITITDFPVPAQTEFPVGRPYCFVDLASPGTMTLSSSRSEFAGFNLTVKNHLDTPFFEAPYIGRAKWCGRDITWTNKLLYKTAADRTNYEATTATTCSAKFDNGTNSVLFNFSTFNYATAVDDDLGTDKLYYQNISWVNSWNASAGADLVITTA
jgi:hypothetical protein